MIKEVDIEIRGVEFTVGVNWSREEPDYHEIEYIRPARPTVDLYPLFVLNAHLQGEMEDRVGDAIYEHSGEWSGAPLTP